MQRRKSLFLIHLKFLYRNRNTPKTLRLKELDRNMEAVVKMKGLIKLRKKRVQHQEESIHCWLIDKDSLNCNNRRTPRDRLSLCVEREIENEVRMNELRVGGREEREREHCVRVCL